MLVQASRFLLRDFRETDRQAFVTYQMDPRYRRLYDFGDGDERRAHDLFDRFLSWQHQDPRQDFQVGIFATDTGRLCGCCGLRRSGALERAAVLGIELTPNDWGRYRLAIDVASVLIEYAFFVLDVDSIIGSSASGNRRVEGSPAGSAQRSSRAVTGRNGSQHAGGSKSIGLCIATNGPALGAERDLVCHQEPEPLRMRGSPSGWHDREKPDR